MLADFLCEHGAVQPRCFPYVNDLVEPVSESVWQILQKRFRGGPSCNKLYECDWCRSEADRLRMRQQKEAATFRRLESDVKKEQQYAIAMQWWRRWNAFALGTSKSNQPDITVNSCGLVMPPGAIDNSPIATKEGELKRGPHVDYVCLNEETWLFLHSIYGGGPKLLLTSRGSCE